MSRLSLLSAILLSLSLAACATAPVGPVLPGGSVTTGGAGASLPTTSGRPLPASAPIVRVVARLQPVAEAYCISASRARNCEFIVAVDDDPGEPANAFQSLDPAGRPVIVFTEALLRAAYNEDELAFVLGHEVAHHIIGHIGIRARQARRGAIVGTILARVSGLGLEQTQQMQAAVANMAAQRYSKEFELEADALGAELAYRAGYDPIKGAGFFMRLPDPGDHSAGSHPSNAQRRAVVYDTMRRLHGF